MTISRIIFFSLLGASLLFGQTPFQMRYCWMMKRSIDVRMLQCCSKHNRTSDTRTPRIIAPFNMMQVLAKPTIGAFEKKPHDRGTDDYPDRVEFLQTIPDATFDRCFAGEVEYPPPDLTIHNLTLRI
jgi:hypothetical protein